jgi:Ca2+-binding RTX toxin-like protein
VLAGGQDDDRYLFFTATVNQIDTVLEQSEGGIDTLDFAAIATTVTVDLTSDSLTATMDHRIVQSGAGLSANLENVIGGSNNDQITGNSANNLLAGNGGDDTIAGGGGNDVLLGGQGNDVLQGISGRNILFGGPGGDVLQGGTGDDLLLSGSSIYESDPDVLAALMAEWSSGNTYQMRVDHLKGDAGGGANTSFILTSSTVTSDADADYLTGSGGQDWFLANSLQDPISDQAVNETFTHIDAWV